MARDFSGSSRSEVVVVGRLGSKVQERVLPSGDRITIFSVVVDRPPRERHSEVSVDTIACSTATRAVVNRLTGLDPGTWVEATGVLRRRFWRTGTGLGSAMEVDVRRLQRVRASD